MVGIVDPARIEGQSKVASSAAETPSTPPGEWKENLQADLSLKDSSTPWSSLTELCFGPSNEAPVVTKVVTHTSEAVPISSASSTCTRESESGALSDVDGVTAGGVMSPPPRIERDSSVKINEKVSLRKTSRQGRSNQRWVSEGNDVIRLVTGCVPILRDGKVMFVSSRRKPEWIIPKGGFENDETMEESAVRECFEEAGVFGVLGPQLSEVQYETRKAKKRRLELENLEQQIKSEKRSKDAGVTEEGEKLVSVAPLSNEEIIRIRDESSKKSSGQDDKQSEGKGSTGSASHNQVRMSLFPLYVHQVLNDWPESGRFRRAVHIDEAIKMLDARPELQTILQEVKDRGLFHMPEELAGQFRVQQR